MRQLALLIIPFLGGSVLCAQNVGIGISSPVEKLEVNGGIKIGMNTGDAEGTIRWNAVISDFEGRVDDDRWVSLTGGKSKWGNTEQYATENGGKEGHTLDTLYGEAISAQGNRLVVGAPKAQNGIYTNAGKVEIMTIGSNGIAGFIQSINPPSIGNDFQFGKSVATDQNMMVVGEPQALVNGNTQQGRAYIYLLNANNQPVGAPQVLEQAVAEGSSFDKFGSTVAVAGDYIAVAATEKSVNGNAQQGKVYMYRRFYIFGEPTDAFVFEMVISAPDGVANMQFGSSISLTYYSMAIGAPQTTISGNQNAGKVYVYRRLNNTWQYETTLTTPNPVSNTYFGKSVRINTAGDTLVAGAPKPSGLGAVMVFSKSGNSWQLSSVINSPDEMTTTGFGWSVDFLSGKILAGARNARVGLHQQQGKAYLFSYQEATWRREAVFSPYQGGPYFNFGNSVRLTSDKIFISAPGYTSPGTRSDRGRVYWFFKN